MPWIGRIRGYRELAHSLSSRAQDHVSAFAHSPVCTIDRFPAANVRGAKNPVFVSRRHRWYPRALLSR